MINEVSNPRQLPESDPFVRKEVVKYEFGFKSDSTLYRQMEAGHIPQPDTKVNQVNLWLWSSILKAKQKWLEKN